MKSWGSIIRVALLGIGAGCHTSDVYSVNLQCETRKRRRKREGPWHSIVSSCFCNPFPLSFPQSCSPCLHAEVTLVLLKLRYWSQQLACVQSCFKLITGPTQNDMSVLKTTECSSCLNWHMITAIFKQQKYFKTSTLLSLRDRMDSFLGSGNAYPKTKSTGGRVQRSWIC